MNTNTGRALGAEAKAIINRMQKNEITEYFVYRAVAKTVKDDHNRGVLNQIADEEKKHAEIWRAISGTEQKPNRVKVAWFTFLARLLGFTFALKLMEKGETGAVGVYDALSAEVPEAKEIAADEEKHEQALLQILDEERLQYVGSMVLGLSDALVELTGTLAGLTFALQNNKLVALSGLITGISATLSMTSSEYLAARSEGHKNPLKSSLYTGFVYLFTVVCLVLPYLLLPKDAYVQSLATMIAIVVVIIFAFTYYISVAKDLPFTRRFAEMAGISLSVAAVSFVIGLLVKRFLGIDI